MPNNTCITNHDYSQILNVGMVPIVCILNVGTVPTFSPSKRLHVNDLLGGPSPRGMLISSKDGHPLDGDGDKIWPIGGKRKLDTEWKTEKQNEFRLVGPGLTT